MFLKMPKTTFLGNSDDSDIMIIFDFLTYYSPHEMAKKNKCTKKHYIFLNFYFIAS